MDYQTALNILGLKPGFNEEELKSAWRKLSKENHPDKHRDAEQMNERQSLINAARDFLKDYAHKVNPNKNAFDINAYITKKINELESILQDDDKIILDEDFARAYEEIKKVIGTFKADVFLSFILSKQDVDQAYALCMISIKMSLEKYKTLFYQKHYIDESEVEETINYDCSLKELYEQLLKIETKYSKKAKVRRQLEEEIQKYKNYVGYERVGLLVEVCKNNTLHYIEQNNFQNIEDEINKMHQRIVTEVFEKYNSIKKSILDLGVIVAAIPDETIKKEYDDISQEFQRGSSFHDTEEAVKRIKKLIDDYLKLQQKMQEFKENETSINQIYESLIDRYSDILKRNHISTEYDTITCLSELLSQILELFKKGCDNLQKLEYFKLFNEITFTNLAHDNQVIKQIATQTISIEEDVMHKIARAFSIPGDEEPKSQKRK